MKSSDNKTQAAPKYVVAGEAANVYHDPANALRIAKTQSKEFNQKILVTKNDKFFCHVQPNGKLIMIEL
jgi:hypothetical protein